MSKYTSIANLQTSVYMDEGMSIVMTQTQSVQIECHMRGNSVVKVTAPDGITFKAENGMTFDLPANWNITDLCNLPFLARQIVEEDAERLTDAQISQRDERAVYSGVREFVAM